MENGLKKNGIEILNVAGPRASKDPLIYGLVTVILELVYNLEIAKDDRPILPYSVLKTEKPDSTDQPKTVDEAIRILTNELSLKDKNIIANMAESDLIDLHFSLGLSIRNKFLYPINEKLLESCRQEIKDKYLHWDQASSVIIKALWKRFRKTHKLRVVE